jgi:UDP-galactopyranose mutase
MEYDYLIVGAGFAGAVCARQLADRNYSVMVIDKRGHIAGNAYDEIDKHGIRVHRYGPHLFHTNSEMVFKYLSRFTSWKFYEHRVLVNNEGSLYPFPINLNTINQFFNITLTEGDVEKFLDSKRIAVGEIKTSEDVVLSSVGTELCDAFYRGYTLKQWGLGLENLSAGVAHRIPVRTNTDDRYFTDKYQFMPENGYTELFTNMLSSENITVALNVDYSDDRHKYKFKRLIYTGPIDKYFGYIYGKLPYRSLKFEFIHKENIEYIQPVATVNYPNTEKFTRITEFKRIHESSTSGTTYVAEYPTDTGDPYYPIPTIKNNDIYKKYRELAESEINTYFVGRLAEYKYYNMDQVVASALTLSNKIIKQVEDNKTN